MTNKINLLAIFFLGNFFPLQSMEFLFNKINDAIDYISLGGTANYMLYQAIIEQNIDLAQKAYEERADVHRVLTWSGGRTIRSGTFLHLACIFYNVQIVEWLLDHNLGINQADADGHEPLYYAAGLDEGMQQAPCWPIVELLLKRGANVHIWDKQNARKPLVHYIAAYKRWDLLPFFLQNGVDINISDNNNNQLIHTACRQSNRKVVKWLLEQGSNIDALYKVNNRGFGYLEGSCIDIAWIGHTEEQELWQLLIEEGACVPKKLSQSRASAVTTRGLAERLDPLLGAILLDDAELIEIELDKLSRQNPNRQLINEALLLAAAQGHSLIFTFLRQAFGTILTEEYLQESLVRAAGKGHIAIVKTIIETCQIEDNKWLKALERALFRASMRQQQNVSNYLIDFIYLERLPVHTNRLLERLFLRIKGRGVKFYRHILYKIFMTLIMQRRIERIMYAFPEEPVLSVQSALESGNIFRSLPSEITYYILEYARLGPLG